MHVHVVMQFKDTLSTALHEHCWCLHLQMTFHLITHHEYIWITKMKWESERTYDLWLASNSINNELKRTRSLELIWANVSQRIMNWYFRWPIDIQIKLDSKFTHRVSLFYHYHWHTSYSYCWFEIIISWMSLSC